MTYFSDFQNILKLFYFVIQACNKLKTGFFSFINLQAKSYNLKQKSTLFGTCKIKKLFISTFILPKKFKAVTFKNLCSN